MNTLDLLIEIETKKAFLALYRAYERLMELDIPMMGNMTLKDVKAQIKDLEQDIKEFNI